MECSSIVRKRSEMKANVVYLWQLSKATLNLFDYELPAIFKKKVSYEIAFFTKKPLIKNADAYYVNVSGSLMSFRPVKEEMRTELNRGPNN